MTVPRDPLELLVVAHDEFGRRLRLVGAGDWRRPTPCSEWNVRALVNHVVGANVRYRLLLRGASTERVEATRDVDHLGDDAPASFIATADGVVACFREEGVFDRIAHHVAGDRTGRELLSMRILDSAVHAWDLARAIGADETLDEDVVAFLLAYTAGLDLGPRQHAFAPAHAGLPRTASRQDQLLHRLGRSPIGTEEVE
ncbi:TIGR03086 family metal-binding protein [Amycolatopsis sp. NPDC021455]|uniref:TIGR03086 family metal-binding protein n=1 Tax=Amycolatopsis sp. NPDC021455 TaxID=3154901 RepID=UPI003403AD9B